MKVEKAKANRLKLPQFSFINLKGGIIKQLIVVMAIITVFNVASGITIITLNRIVTQDIEDTNLLAERERSYRSISDRLLETMLLMVSSIQEATPVLMIQKRQPFRKTWRTFRSSWSSWRKISMHLTFSSHQNLTKLNIIIRLMSSTWPITILSAFKTI